MSKKIGLINVSPLLEEKHLVELFSCCGKVINCKLSANTDETLPSTCLIEFETEEHKKAALFLNDTALGDRPLKVFEVPNSQMEPPKHHNLREQQEMTAEGMTQATKALLNASNALVTQNTVPALFGMDQSLARSSALPAVSPLVKIQQANMKSDSSHNILFAATQQRNNEIARTIYVGNLAPIVVEDTLRAFFASCGEILFVKMAGDALQNVKYAFIEFVTLEGANTAMQLSGTMLGDKPIKIGHANNPIVKSLQTVTASSNEAKKLKEAMKKVEEAKRRLEKRVSGGDEKEKSESKHRHRHRSRSRSRDRHRRRSHRSRSRDRNRRSRSRDRDIHKRRSRSPRVKTSQLNEGMFWDGFNWLPVEPVQLPIAPQ